MKLFSFLGHARLEPEWTYASHGNIWRILFSQSGHVVGECRDHEQKTVAFFCLNERDGSVLWQDVRLQEPWWVGMDTVYRDVALLHEFANPGLPEHRGIIALDLASGNQLWHNGELTLWFAYKEHLYAYKPRFDKRIGYKLSYTTGVVEEEFEDALDDLYALRKLALDEQRQEGFLFPEVVEQTSENDDITALVMKETKGADIHGKVEFIRQPPFLLMNYYTPARSFTPDSVVLENRFSIFDMERGNKVYSEILATDAKAATPDSFFVKGSQVFFIKNQNLLTALRLPDQA